MARRCSFFALLLVVTLCLAAVPSLAGPIPRAQPAPRAYDPSPPAQTLKLIFIHHSCGENWLADDNGGLGLALRDNNYFVSDTYYGWDGGGVGIGDRTDIGHWWEWFLGPDRDAILHDLYTESDRATSYSRRASNPGGENQIVLFKSCYPNSNLRGGANDPPTLGANPLAGEDCYSTQHTVANAKAIYRDLLAYFQTRPDKLFIAVTAPPVRSGTYAANARAFNTWLVNDWLDGYPLNNVRVWDFYNALTSNGGNWATNDLGAVGGNHHRYRDGAVQYVTNLGGNTAAYPAGGSDDHPSAAGNLKATGEFLPLLNIWVHAWLGTTGTPEPTPSATTQPPTATRTPTLAATRTRTPSATMTPGGQQTATPTVAAAQHVAYFQRGRLPDAGYDSAPDAVLASDDPDTNLGGYETLEVFFAEQEVRRSLLRWDVSSLPPGAHVQAAVVQLARYDGDAESDMDVALYRLTNDWVEGSGSVLWPDQPYTADGATWNRSSAYAAWARPGGDLDLVTDYGNSYPGVVGRVTIPQTLTTGMVTIDATGAVRDWVERQAPNYGLALLPLNGQYTYHYFRSGDYTVPAVRPRLVVTYTVGSPARDYGLTLPLIVRQ